MLFFVNPGEDDISQIVFIYFNSFLQSFQVGEQFYSWYWLLLKGSSVLFSHEAYGSEVHDTNNTKKRAQLCYLCLLNRYIQHVLWSGGLFSGVYQRDLPPLSSLCLVYSYRSLPKLHLKSGDRWCFIPSVTVREDDESCSQAASISSQSELRFRIDVPKAKGNKSYLLGLLD